MSFLAIAMLSHPPFPFQFFAGQRFRRLSQFAATVFIALMLFTGEKAIAQATFDETTQLLLTNPLNPNGLDAEAVPSDGSIVTAEMVEQNPPAGLTLPSLWWTQAQFGGKLLDTWIANFGLDGTPPRVDLVVNQQVWSIISYTERYAFLNEFGTAARDFGFSTRVFNRQQELLAAYICPDFQAAACTVFLDPSGPGGLQGGSTLISPFPAGGF